MKAKLSFLVGCLLWGSLQLGTAQTLQYVGHWFMNEGSGATLFNSSSTNWNMTINGDTNLWGYQQPGAYQFANGGYATSAVISNAPWASGSHLILQADFNVTGNLHDPGQVFGGGGIFAADYFIPGGNSLGYNFGAFYTQVLTPSGGTPSIELDISGIPPGRWSQSLPSSVTNANINGGWNRAGWDIKNNAAQNSMTVQFMLNGTNIGPAVQISPGAIGDYTTASGYGGTEFTIGACGAGYQTFGGAISNVTLTTGSDPSCTIVQQTNNVLPGTDVTFQGVAAGTAPFYYQWFFNGTNAVSNATSASLALTNVTAGQSGSYTLVVSNALGTASATANLLVFVPADVQLHFYHGLTIQGTVGFNYLIEYTDASTGPNNWQTITNLALPSSPYNWFDLQSPYVATRTYRVVAAP